MNSAGVLVSSWYDRRVDAINNNDFSVFATQSLDSGFNWGANFQVSDVVSPVSENNPHFDGLINPCYHGDYDQIEVEESFVHIVWADDRRVTATGPNPDVYYDRARFRTACDINEDGQVDLRDALLGGRILRGDAAATDQQRINGDVAPPGALDGKFGAADLLLIARSVRGDALTVCD